KGLPPAPVPPVPLRVMAAAPVEVTWPPANRRTPMLLFPVAVVPPRPVIWMLPSTDVTRLPAPTTLRPEFRFVPEPPVPLRVTVAAPVEVTWPPLRRRMPSFRAPLPGPPPLP